MIPFIQSLIDATSAGAVYALAALGIGLVFGVLRLANFANGEIITGAAYALLLLWPVSWPLALVASVMVAIALSLLMDLAVFRWMRSQSPAALLIASFGVSILLQRFYEGVFGARVRSGSAFSLSSRSFSRGSSSSPCICSSAALVWDCRCRPLRRTSEWPAFWASDRES